MITSKLLKELGKYFIRVGEGGSGVSDHGALTGLSDDDHAQYHNDARGDARYYTKSQVDSSLSNKLSTSGGELTGDLRGTDFIKTQSSTINYSGGNVSSVEYDGGRTITFTYTGDEITSLTDGTNTWTINRTGDDVTGITVT